MLINRENKKGSLVMSLVAIRQERSGKNTHFVTEDFQHYSLDEIIKKGESIPLGNVTVVLTKSGRKYLRSKPNTNKSDNLDQVAITCNAGDYLLFDREYLYLKALNGRVKRKWAAFSGKPDSDISDQNKMEFGPLPEGEYEVYFDKTLDYDNNEGWLNALKWKLKKGAWGYIATPIKQVKGEPFGRGSFYIHGGEHPGTEGCIELNGELNKNFHSFIKLYQRNFKLVVKYSK